MHLDLYANFIKLEPNQNNWRIARYPLKIATQGNCTNWHTTELDLSRYQIEQAECVARLEACESSQSSRKNVLEA